VGGTATDGSSGLQKVDYTYNIRGWLTGINDTQNLQDSAAAQPDLFAFKINYNTLDNNQTDVKKLYNGNISETRWRTNFDNLTRSYGYTYDALNRLTNAQYVRPSNPNNPNAADIIDTFNERLSYDKNGNIQTLVRNGGMESQTTVPVMDNLTYQYDTNTKNKLIKVTDATANTDGFKDGANTTEEYGYDDNGNMTRDDNKNIRSIVYNHLNLPTKIVFQNGGDFPSISYLYTATGKKVAKTVNIASRRPIIYTVDYLDGYQYESGKLLFFPTAEGYVKYTENVRNPFDYVFNYTDHLGNVRLSYGINPSTGILTKIEENNYYPFGLKHATYNNTAKMIAKVESTAEVTTVSGKYMVQKTDPVVAELERPPMEMPPGGMIDPMVYSGYNYKYNGKELQEELGLNMYDYGARNYDPALGRWMNIDPLAERATDWTPYRYAFNNPLSFTDPTGMYEDWVEKENGDIYWDNNATSQATTKEGETYRGTTYARSKEWNNVRGVTGNVLEIYKDDKSMQYSAANSSGMVELPVDNPNALNSQFTAGSKVLYSTYNRNDEKGPGDQWGKPEYIAKMINSIVDYRKTYGNDVIAIGDMLSPSDSKVPKNSTGGMHHADAGTFDIRLLGSGGSYKGGVSDGRFDSARTQSFINALGNNGFIRFLIGPSVYEQFKNSGSIKVMNGGKVHDNHYHVDMGKR